MRNNKFLSNAIGLLFTGFVVKILGMIGKIYYTRVIGEYGMSLFNLIMPTYSLLMSIALFSLPLAINTLISSNKYSSSKVVFNAFLISFFMNLVIFIFVFFVSEYLCSYLLKEPLVRSLLIISTFTIPFVSISSILKAYFLGKQNILPSSLSNIIEQLFRLVLIILILPFIVKKDLMSGLIFLTLINLICEVVSILVLFIFLPKNSNFSFCTDKSVLKNLFSVSCPATASKLIGNISYFFEPIIIVYFMTKFGYSKDYIVFEYGLYNSYCISLLLMPNFFINAISGALLPELSNYYSNSNKYLVKRRIKQSISISLLIGAFFSTTIFLFRDSLLNILFNSINSSKYVRDLSLWFILFYLESPLSTVLVSLRKNKELFFISFFGIIVKNICLVLFLIFDFGIYSLLYSEIINVIFICIFDFMVIKKAVFTA